MSDTTSPKKMTPKQTELELGEPGGQIVLSRRKLEKFKHNPFVDDHLITQLSGQKNVHYTQTTAKTIIDTQTGEIEPAKLQVVKKVRADKEQFVKIFTTHLKAFFELSTTAYKVLHYVMHEIQNKSKDKDEVYLCLADCQEFFESQGANMSKATYSRAMTELVKKFFLAETFKTNMYFINPKLFFNGDRVEWITKFYWEDKDTKQTLENNPQIPQITKQKEDKNDTDANT